MVLRPWCNIIIIILYSKSFNRSGSIDFQWSLNIKSFLFPSFAFPPTPPASFYIPVRFPFDPPVQKSTVVITSALCPNSHHYGNWSTQFRCKAIPALALYRRPNKPDAASLVFVFDFSIHLIGGVQQVRFTLRRTRFFRIRVIWFLLRPKIGPQLPENVVTAPCRCCSRDVSFP